MINQNPEEKKRFLDMYWDTIKKEKDLYIFKYMWYNCIIQRFAGHLNWYVAIPCHSNLYNKNYYEFIEENIDEIQKAINNIEVHWWLTFWWEYKSISIEWYDFSFCFWFDTAHLWDAFYDRMSWRVKMWSFWEEWEYRDYNYVLSEVKRLVEQIDKIDRDFILK